MKFKKNVLVFLSFVLLFSSLVFPKSSNASSVSKDTYIINSNQESFQGSFLNQDQDNNLQFEAQSKRDGQEAFELGLMVYHGLLNSPVNMWHKGSFESSVESLIFHFHEHAAEVNATDVANYLNKAMEFRRIAKKGVKPSEISGEVPNVKRYRKNGRYIDLAPGDFIVSFGSTN